VCACNAAGHILPYQSETPQTKEKGKRIEKE
jgi:hypothetical protein